MIFQVFSPSLCIFTVSNVLMDLDKFCQCFFIYTYLHTSSHFMWYVIYSIEYVWHFMAFAIEHSMNYDNMGIKRSVMNWQIDLNQLKSLDGNKIWRKLQKTVEYQNIFCKLNFRIVKWILNNLMFSLKRDIQSKSCFFFWYRLSSHQSSATIYVLNLSKSWIQFRVKIETIIERKQEKAAFTEFSRQTLNNSEMLLSFPYALCFAFLMLTLSSNNASFMVADY